MTLMSRFDEAQDDDDDIIGIPNISEALINRDKYFERGNRKSKKCRVTRDPSAVVAREAFRASRSLEDDIG